MSLPPIQAGEVYIRCGSCLLIGWTVDEPDEALPSCPQCGGVVSEVGVDAEGMPHVVIIDGAPSDPAHHLGGGA